MPTTPRSASKRGLVTLDGRGATGLVTLPDAARLWATFRGLTFTGSSGSAAR
jgi:hypothetical protein